MASYNDLFQTVEINLKYQEFIAASNLLDFDPQPTINLTSEKILNFVYFAQF